MSIHATTLSLLVLATAVFSGLIQATHAEMMEENGDLTVLEVLNKSANNLRVVDSLQFSSDQWIEFTEAGAKQSGFPVGRTPQKMKYASHGAKYRSEVRITDIKKGTTNTKIAAYDGDRYQYYQPESRTLTKSLTPRTTHLSVAINPLVVPYVFLFQPKERVDLQTVKDPQLWDRFVDEKRPRLLETDNPRLKGLVGMRINEPNTPGLSHREVYFDPNRNYFPVLQKMITADGEVINVTAVKDFQLVETKAGSIFIPLRLSSYSYVNGQVTQQIDQEIAAASLAVNQLIPDELFSIPESQVDIVIDADLGVQIPVAGYGASIRGINKIETSGPQISAADLPETLGADTYSKSEVKTPLMTTSSGHVTEHTTTAQVNQPWLMAVGVVAAVILLGVVGWIMTRRLGASQ